MSRNSTELIARNFHDKFQELSSSDGRTSAAWAELPERHRHTLMTVIEDLISRGIIAPGSAPYTLIR